jgi:hypothetical protein
VEACACTSHIKVRPSGGAWSLQRGNVVFALLLARIFALGGFGTKKVKIYGRHYTRTFEREEV